MSKKLIFRPRILGLIQRKETELKKRLTVVEIAKGVGVSRHTITLWLDAERESGFVTLNVETLGKIADYFGVSHSDLGEFVEVDEIPESIASTGPLPASA